MRLYNLDYKQLMQKQPIQLANQYDNFNQQHQQQQIQEYKQQQQQQIQGNLVLKNNLYSQQTYKSFWTVFFIILNISLSPFYFGYIIAYFSAVEFTTIVQVYHIQISKELAQGILVSCLPIGGGIGAYASGFLLEKYSRRQCLLIVNSIAFLAGFILFIKNVQFLLFARILQGMCAGLYSSIAPLIMKQISPNQLSGTMTTCNQIFIGFGIFFAFVFSQILEQFFNDETGHSTWKISFAFPFLILIVQTIFLKFVYNFQTPKYLIQNNKDQQAKILIQKIYKQEYVDKIIKQIKQNVGKNNNNKNGQNNVDINNLSNKFSILSTSRSAIIISIHLSALQQFCGINAVMAYGGQIVGQSLPSLKLTLPILLNLQQVIASIFTSFLLTRIGRKKLLELGSVGAALTCFVVGVGFLIRGDYPKLSLGLIIFGLVLFMANFGITLGPVVWVYLPEIVQPKILSYAAMVNWLTAAFIMLFFPVLKQNLPSKNPALLFFFFSFWCIISFFINKNYLIETKNKTEKQIFNQFSKKKALF